MSCVRASRSLLACVGAIAAGGCGGSHPRSDAPSAAVTVAAAWHRVVLCARAHGMPGLADPRIDATGKAIFPSGPNVPDETRRACRAMFDRLQPDARSRPPTRAELASLLRFARCMRGHGIADWPDPRPDGSFSPDARITGSLKSAFRSQLVACEHFNPDPHGRVYFDRS
jgi:hypothetical protein